MFKALKFFWLFAKDEVGAIKRKLWNKRLLLYWSRLWIRKDEFHPSLNMDMRAMLEMNKAEREKYINNLVKRRQIAHDRDMESGA